MNEVGYRITIELAVDRDQYDDPAQWDWPTLLDMPKASILTPPTAMKMPLKEGSLLQLVKKGEVGDGSSEGNS